jgi:hypothetical protein
LGTPGSLIQITSELIPAMLALTTAWLTVRLFHVVRRDYLLGLPIGFSFLAFGYLLFGVSYTYSSLTDPLMWLGLLSQSYGFAFVTMTYLLKKSKWGGAAEWLLSGLVILAVIGLATIIVSAERIPSFQIFDEAFRLTNIFLLANVVVNLYQSVRAERPGIGTSVLASYILLAGSQYSYLIWGLDGGFWSFALGHLLEFVALALLAVILVDGLRRHR